MVQQGMHMSLVGFNYGKQKKKNKKPQPAQGKKKKQSSLEQNEYSTSDMYQKSVSQNRKKLKRSSRIKK